MRKQLFVAVLLAMPALAFGADGATASATDVAAAFTKALETGDKDAALALLLPNVLVYEAGGAETSAAEYAAKHLPADIAFLADLEHEQISQVSGGDGISAWVATRGRLKGRHKGKSVDLDTAETLIMARTPDGWRIAHIHWSSAPRGNR